MSKQIFKLYEYGLGDEIKKYMRNLNDIAVIKNCVNATNVSTNIYKTVASFEDAGIVNSSELPVGDEKQKMNFLLSAAISKLAPIIKDNLKLAGAAAKRWNENVGDDNQQERLNAVVTKLKTPVKDQAIPSYSSLSEDQRSVVQRVFQEALKKEEPVSIDFIIEAIDRYNAGADRGLMFDKLGLVLDQSTSIAAHDQSAYEALMTDDMFAYLLTRWESYQKMINAISEEPSLTATNLSVIVDTARFSKSSTLDAILKNATAGLDFSKPLDEYKQAEKPTTSFADIKPYLQDNSIIKSMSTNNSNRLRGLCTIVSQLEDMEIYHIDDSQSDMSSDECYHALAVYFEVMEEITQNLMVFLFLTQTTVRNATMVQDIITVVNTVDTILTDLFNRVNDATIVSGNISQEGFTSFVSKLLGHNKREYLEKKALSTKIKGDATNVLKLSSQFKAHSNNLVKLKLRDTNSITDSSLKDFKEMHSETISKVFGVNIDKMDSHALFTFMTNDIFSTKITPSLVGSLSTNVLMSSDPVSKDTLRALTTPEDIAQLFATPFLTERYTWYDCMVNVANEYHNLIDITQPGVSADVVTSTVRAVAENFTYTGGSYFVANDDFKRIFVDSELEVVPSVKFIQDETNKVTYLGYRETTSGSMLKILNGFVTNPRNEVTLNSIKNNNMYAMYGEHTTSFVRLVTHTVSYVNATHGGRGMIDVCDKMEAALPAIKTAISKNSNFDKPSALQYCALAEAMVDDLKGAIHDMEARESLALVAYNSMVNVTKELRELYINFNIISEDFIKLAK